MAIDSFIKMTGPKGDIKGDSAVSEFEDQIQILAWSWGLSQTSTAHLGTGAGAGKVNVQDLSFTHYVDSASPVLVQSCCQGTHFPKAILTMRKAGGEKAVDYMKFEFEDLIVTSVSTGGSSGEDLLTENVVISFARFKMAYQPQDNKGAKKGGAINAGWDVLKEKVWA